MKLIAIPYIPYRQDVFDQHAQKDLWRVMDCDSSGSVNKEEFVTFIQEADDEAAGTVGGGQSADEMWEAQRKEYASRGISLTHFEAETTSPFLVNLDEDPFRSNRFMYLLKTGLWLRSILPGFRRLPVASCCFMLLPVASCCS